MGFFDKVRGEFVDIIEWIDDTNNTLVHRFDRYGNEIKYEAQLVVREAQQAVFINEGRIADVFKPGRYVLNTKNLPILTTLQGWKYGFHSPFKCEVYFCSTRLFTNLKWGTPGPVTMRDKEFGPVRVTAFGIYSMRVKDPAVFIREIVGTDGNFTTEAIEDNLRGKIGLRIKEVLPETGIPVIDLEGKVVILGQMLKERIVSGFEGFGLELTEVQVQDIGLPEEVERAIDKSGAMKAIGDLRAYTQYETAESIPTAAANPGGTAAAGVGIGMGFGMANQMTQSFAGQQAGPSQTPPPLPGYYLAAGGQQAGPFGVDILKQKMVAGELTRNTLVWKSGMEQWTAAGQVLDLAELFKDVPPPIPGK
ncbi:MAG: SPFH domain-containing protein [Nitrospiraceae bacterium]|nr:SPFH domain-containing protein [Nitrospiraceae bacterium]